jgi:demethylmenaquinone methyltransferase/2-methoxy-6-polyprenyl-1,4-benzoquinol methylase
VNIKNHKTCGVPSRDNDKLFSTVATRYDFLNHLFSLNIDKSWRKKLVRCAGVSAKGGSAFGRKPGENILDVCTGTGDIAIRFAQSDSVGEIIGIDLSEEMLHIARRKTKSNGFEGKIKLLKADVLNLPFDDGSFDVVSIGFGLRNLTDRKKGISEMVRVLKDGGRLVILEFSPPPSGLFGAVYRFYLNTIMQAVGGIISGSASAYRYLSSSIANFPKPEDILKLMQAEGLKKLYSERLTGGIVYIYRGKK